ncbi:MAG: hypothetical protein AzoDbin1_03882 [Azoarcus sp.]|nr:hypothetical protein [Azoarcus sp.]
MSFSDYLRKDIRLVMLRTLAEMPSYRANSSVLTNMLDQFGHAVTRDQVKTELRWLAEQGTIDVNEVGSVLVATLTERGQAVATGRARIDGINRPSA